MLEGCGLSALSRADQGVGEVNLEFRVPDELVETIAQRAAQLARQLELDANPPSPYLTVEEAAEFLRCKPKRIYDLRSSGRLGRFNEGGRALVLRSELECLVVEEDDLAARPRAA